MMLRRWYALMAKEVQQHWLAGLVLGCLLAFGATTIVLWGLLAPRTTSVLYADLFFAIVFLPIAAAVLGNRLVVAEWHGRTQLFIEALPIRRAEMVLVKLALGGAFLLGTALAALGATCLLAMRTEPVDGWFATILAARNAGFVACLWTFAFAMGLLGRLRIPIYLFAILLLVAVTSLTELELRRFGPFALLDPETFPTERTDLPLRALGETLALSGLWTALALGLALLNEGSVAEGLSRRTSQKEKATIGVLFFLALVAIISLEQKRPKKPYAFPDKAVVRGALGIEVLYVDEALAADGRAVLDDLERDLGELKALLGWDAFPPVRVAFRPDLDARTFERARIERADGVLVRANFRRTPAWDPRAFTAYVLRETLSHRTRGRARFEPKRWLHDGLSRWWAERGNGRRGKAWPRALYLADRLDPFAERVRRWTALREEVGEAFAEALGFAGLSVLEAEHGADKVHALARAVFGRMPYTDSREVLRERDHPMSRVFAEATGVPWETFLDEWRGALVAARASDAGRALLADVQAARGTIELEPLAGDVRAVAYTFAFDRAPPRGTLCALVHVGLGPFDHELEVHDLRREEHAWGEGAERTWRLAGRYGRGERAFLALEVECPALDAPVRLLATRREVP